MTKRIDYRDVKFTTSTAAIDCSLPLHSIHSRFTNYECPQDSRFPFLAVSRMVVLFSTACSKLQRHEMLESGDNSLCGQRDMGVMEK